MRPTITDTPYTITHYARLLNSGMYCLAIIITMSGCAESNQYGRDSAWNSYDPRHPVPDSSDLPSSTYQRYYQDNDEYYTPPIDYGCTPDNFHMCE